MLTSQELPARRQCQPQHTGSTEPNITVCCWKKPDSPLFCHFQRDSRACCWQQSHRSLWMAAAPMEAVAQPSTPWDPQGEGGEDSLTCAADVEQWAGGTHPIPGLC